MIPIDSGIPIPPAPPRGRTAGGKNLYPWKNLKVGDSFVYRDAGHPGLTRILANNTIAARKQWDRNRYEVRILNGVCRVWRMA